MVEQLKCAKVFFSTLHLVSKIEESVRRRRQQPITEMKFTFSATAASMHTTASQFLELIFQILNEFRSLIGRKMSSIPRNVMLQILSMKTINYSKDLENTFMKT